MRIADFLEGRAVHKIVKQIKNGKNDVKLPYADFMPHESLRTVYDGLDQALGAEAIQWFAYMVRAYNADEPLRIHVSHRGDTLTSAPGGQPHPEWGAPLKKIPDSPNYTYKRFDPRALPIDEYSSSDVSHVKDSGSGAGDE